MLRAQAEEVFIGRPPEEVFAAYADGEGYPAWFPGVREVRRLTDEPVRAGARFRGAFPGIGVVEWEVVEHDPPHRQVHLAHAPMGDLRHFVATDGAPGGTRLRQRGEGQLTGVFGALAFVVEPLMARMMARNWKKTALALKAYLEAQPPAR